MGGSGATMKSVSNPAEGKEWAALRALYGFALEKKDARLMAGLCCKFEGMWRERDPSIDARLALLCFRGMIEFGREWIYERYMNARDERTHYLNLKNVSAALRFACTQVLPGSDDQDEDRNKLFETVKEFLEILRGMAPNEPRLDETIEFGYIPTGRWRNAIAHESFPHKDSTEEDRELWDDGFEYMFNHDEIFSKNVHDGDLGHYHYQCAIAALRSPRTPPDTMKKARLWAANSLLSIENRIVSRLTSKVNRSNLTTAERRRSAEEIMVHYTQFRQWRCLETFAFHVMLTLHMESADHFPVGSPPVYNLRFDPIHERHLSDKRDREVCRKCMSIILKATEMYHLLGRLLCCERDKIFEHFEALRHLVKLVRDPELLGTKRGRRLADWFMSCLDVNSYAENVVNPYHRIVEALSKCVIVRLVRVQMPMQLELVKEVLNGVARDRGMERIWAKIVEEQAPVRELNLPRVLDGMGSVVRPNRSSRPVDVLGLSLRKRSWFAAERINREEASHNGISLPWAMKTSPGLWIFSPVDITQCGATDEPKVVNDDCLNKVMQLLKGLNYADPLGQLAIEIEAVLCKVWPVFESIPDYLPLATDMEASFMVGLVNIASFLRSKVRREQWLPLRSGGEYLSNEIDNAFSPTHLRRLEKDAIKSFKKSICPMLDSAVRKANNIIRCELKSDLNTSMITVSLVYACDRYRDSLEEDGLAYYMSPTSISSSYQEAIVAQIETDALEDCIKLMRLGLFHLGVNHEELDRLLRDRYDNKFRDLGLDPCSVFQRNQYPWLLLDDYMEPGIVRRLEGRVSLESIHLNRYMRFPSRTWIQQRRHHVTYNIPKRSSRVWTNTLSLDYMELTMQVKCMESSRNFPSRKWKVESIDNWRKGVLSDLSVHGESPAIPDECLPELGLGDKPVSLQEVRERGARTWGLS